MQILLGAHETIVKINSKSISIDFIYHFITTHFDSKITKNNIIIPESKENIYHRKFLLKWIYALYSKQNTTLPELKESLIKRYHKSIKIILPKKIVHTLKYTIVDDQTLQLTITPHSSTIAYRVKTFLQLTMTILPTYLQISFSKQEEKERLKAFLSSDTIIDLPHRHLYDKKKMDIFLNGEKSKEKSNPIDQAYMLLGVDSTHSIKSIKKQYKNLAKELHPDRVATDSQLLIKLHTKKFQELLEAYETILHYSSKSP